jgi:predicted nucleic acid-binding protein
MFTIDASVHLNALNAAEEGSSESQAFLAQVSQKAWPVFSPTLLLVEVASAVGRVFENPAQGIALSQALRLLPGHIWIPLDDMLADEASRLGAELRLRGADAVYAAVAKHYKTILVTMDRQQLARLTEILDVLSPVQALGGGNEGES